VVSSTPAAGCAAWVACSEGSGYGMAPSGRLMVASVIIGTEPEAPEGPP
jgi:hypothetical protein